MPVVELNQNNWEEYTNKDNLVVVDFWHERCPWCIKLNPEFEKAAEENSILGEPVIWTRFNILESPENREIAMKMNVMSTPTIMYFCHGKNIEMTMGFKTAQQLHDEVARVMKQSEVCINKSSSTEQFYI